LSTDQAKNALTQALMQRFGGMHVVPVSRAALGLRVLLEQWRERHGASRVALSAAVCHEVVLAVLAAGCEIHFCDVDPVDGLVTESEWARARSLGADVALVVHLYGNPANTQMVRRLFAAPSCLVIDDAAQALGSARDGQVCGAGGDVGLLSFGPTKQIASGNAALLFANRELAQGFSERLRNVSPQPDALRGSLVAAFRAGLDLARARRRRGGGAAAGGFIGLLNGLEPVLAIPYDRDADARTVSALALYADAARLRVKKAEHWSNAIAGTRLQPVGMGLGCVPWRFACRVPGLDWVEQHRISEALRGQGMHVSNWYLPAHWFFKDLAGTLPGVETLAREVFQFWLDDVVTLDDIERQGALVRRQLS
jgi:hypothetical protein